jgi:zinc/manganese transport system ATP-binding protein
VNVPSPGRGRIDVSGLAVAYDRACALSGVDGAFAAGSMTAVVGPNGAGKSTLVKAIAGVLRPAAGRVLRRDFAAREMAYLPQAAEIDRAFPITVADTVLLGAWRVTGAFGRVARPLAAEAARALAAVGLDGLGARPIGALSAGQFQRVLFARLLLQDAPVVVLDEPFTAIDARTTRDLLALVRRWHGEGRTVIAVLHDLEQVRAHFPQTLLLAREPVAWGATQEVLTPANLDRARLRAERWLDEAPVGGARGWRGAA